MSYIKKFKEWLDGGSCKCDICERFRQSEHITDIKSENSEKWESLVVCDNCWSAIKALRSGHRFPEQGS